MKNNIDIAICYHKRAVLFESDSLKPMQLGKAIAKMDLGIRGDDTGDNISAKNAWYAELTAIYWLWKNSDADIKGVFHYRRLLDLNAQSKYADKEIYEVPAGDIKTPSGFLNELDLSISSIFALLENNTVITRKREDLHSWSMYSVGEFASKYVGEMYFDEAMNIIKRDYPEYYPSAKKLIAGSISWFSNISVMKKSDWDEYCSLLFDIISKTEQKVDYSAKQFAFGMETTRWAGYLGEYLTAIFIQRQIDLGRSIAEFPCVVLIPNVNSRWQDMNTYDLESYMQYNLVSIKNTEDANKPKVSVCIAAYNVEDYISEALVSVIKQTLLNIEIIVVNDGSTDSTLEIINTFAETDERIIIISKKHEGPGDTRNSAMELAKGEYIHFMDADDYMDLDFLEGMVRCADKNKSEIVLSYHRCIEDKTKTILYEAALPNFLRDEHLELKEALIAPCHLWDKLYAKKLIKNIPFTSGGGEDIFFWYRSVLIAKNISVMRSVKYNYRFNTVSVQTKPQYVLSVFPNAKLAEDYILSQNNTDANEHFLDFKYRLVNHQISRALMALYTNEDFNRQFYKNAREFLRHEGPANYPFAYSLMQAKNFPEWQKATKRYIRKANSGAVPSFRKLLRQLAVTALPKDTVRGKTARRVYQSLQALRRTLL
jgi:glycosyltransferase involved in cell wall biosynthesis